MSGKPLLPERVPPLDQRLRQILLSLSPGRRVTAATLTGWLSVTEDSADVLAALLSMCGQRPPLATVEIEHPRGKRPVQWWGP